MASVQFTDVQARPTEGVSELLISYQTDIPNS
jgi:hypothetical protein